MPGDETTYPPPEDRPATLSLPGSPTTSTGGGTLPFHTGDVIDGKYRLEGVLGAGGMGVVFEATHLALGERVAVKLVRGGEGGERLRREARIALRIKGEHAVRAMDVGTLPSGAPYVVMERLSGQNLADVLRARGPLPIEDAVDYVLQACEAMAEAHALGVVHRDLKPSNLFLTRRPDGSPLVKVLDFGIAKALALGTADGAPLVSLTASDAVLGSPQYMAPEQVRGAKDVDARADVWAMGVMLHELLAGAPPFAGAVPSAVLAAIVADPPARVREARAEVPEGLAEIIRGCLEKDPARRTPSIGALAAALAPFAPPSARVSLERIARITGQAGLDTAAPAVESAPPPSQPGAAAISVERGGAASPAPPRRALGVVAALGAAALLVVAWRVTRPADDPRAAAASPASVLPTAPAPAPSASITASVATQPEPSARPAEPVAAAPSATATSAAALPSASARTPVTTVRRPPPSKPASKPNALPGVDIEAATAQRH